MADTLLAYLVPKLTSRVEDTATDALAFILNRSEACLGALDRLLRDQDFRMEPITAVRTQVTYEDGSRPDMAGYDRNGAKRLLVESKFWAGLLLGQSDGYFGQLDEAGPGVLLFIAPDSRIDTLWAEIRRQMETSDKGIRLEIIETGDRTRRAGIAGSDKQLMLVSWALLLDALAVAASGDAKVSSDILQLRGLARREDQEAFLPIHRDELAPSLPRRIRGLHRLINDVVDGRGVPQGWMSVEGFRATATSEGYGRYFRFTFTGVAFTGVRDNQLFLGTNFRRWQEGSTPLWLQIRVPRLGFWDKFIPIHLQTGLEYEGVLEDVVRQVRAVEDMIDREGVSLGRVRADDAPPEEDSPAEPGAG